MQALLLKKSNKCYILWLCVCTFALVTQHEKRIHPSILSYVVCPAVPYFSTLSHKGSNVRENSLLNVKVLISSGIFISSISHCLLNSWWNDQICMSEWKYLLFLSGFNGTWICSTDFRDILKYSFHENPSRGSRVVQWGRTDRQTRRILGYVIPVVYAKLISRKGAVYNTTKCI